MGRLFWKFFLFFWLAQMVTSTGVGFAFWALREEVLATPKPGLVDRADSGAHKDMDMTAFLASASALHRQSPRGTSRAPRPPRLTKAPIRD